MDAWNTYELQSVCSRLSSGKGIRAKDISETGKYPVYGGNGIRGYTDTYNFDGECAVIGRQGANCGNVRFFSGKAYMTEHAVVVCANENNHTRFLSYLLSTMQLGRLSGQSAQPGLAVKTLGIQPVCVPKLDAQKRIASVLGALDDKIALNQQINRNLEEQAQAIYKDMLCENDSKAVELQELCTFQEGYVNPPQGNTEYFDGEVKWLRAVDINESYIINTSRTLTKEGFDSAKKSALLFEPDTIAISKSGTIGRLGIIGDYMCGNRAVINIKPKQKEMLPFIYLYLKSRQREFAELAVGSVQKNLYVSLLEPLIVMIPKKDVLQSFCENVDRQFEMIKRNCLENERLSQIRDALLPRLMSGEIDVSGVEI